MFDIVALSEALGYISIACWLGAQFPQIIHNYHRKSCDGLALPFLANWFLGDFSNLIGCILTDQLPFQTYLATYFVFVDLTLCAQFWHYYRPAKSSGHSRVHSARSRATSDATIQRLPSERGTHRYRTLSVVAANVAAAAALAAQQQERSDPAHPTTADSRWLHDSTGRLRTSSVASAYTEGDDELDENAVSALADSFLSERIPRRSRRVSWTNEPQEITGSRQSSHISRSTFLPHHPPQPIEHGLPSDSLSRGRPLQREDGLPSPVQADSSPINRSSASRASRRGAGLVFLGAWALFSVGTLISRRHGYPITTYTGSVLHATPTSLPDLRDLSLSSNDVSYVHPSHEQPSMQHIIGRISAWLCTTLYLTSRLPQIWKNFVRKSVEGLSMYLFVFAFLGNVFYVASILTSPVLRQPPPISTAFIRESIPYLLGSGGTLMFDVTIVAQSFVYRPRAKRHHSSSRGARLAPEEEAALLRSDVLDQQEEHVGGRDESERTAL